MYCDIVIGAKWGPPQYKYLLRGCEIINYSQGKKNLKGIDLEKNKTKKERKKKDRKYYLCMCLEVKMKRKKRKGKKK